jgi:hypothetical protein
MRFSQLGSGFVPLLLIGALACSSHHEARTAREFVQEYSNAWKTGDVDAVLAMRSVNKRPDPGLNQDTTRASREALLVDEKKEVEQSVKRRDFSYISWSNTEYVSEQEHTDHVHVSVSVAGALSSIVLVREEGVLKIHPNPGSFR